MNSCYVLSSLSRFLKTEDCLSSSNRHYPENEVLYSFSFIIECNRVTLAHKTIQIPSAQLNKTPSAHCVQRS